MPVSSFSPSIVSLGGIFGVLVATSLLVVVSGSPRAVRLRPDHVALSGRRGCRGALPRSFAPG